jgi:hypothetical protein
MRGKSKTLRNEKRIGECVVMVSKYWFRTLAIWRGSKVRHLIRGRRNVSEDEHVSLGAQ